MKIGSRSTKFEELATFILKRMRMAHIYQPVMLMEMTRRGGSASVEDIAKALLSQDQSQIDYYQEITKGMVGDVLSTKNGIVEKLKEGNRIAGDSIPNFEELSKEEVQELLEICQSKVKQYIQARGERIWSHRLKSSGYISGSVQFEVLKRAKHRCELCGTLDGDKALQVDHIVPRNHGGSDDISNLQALCYSCNAMKRDRDDTDFRGISSSYDDRSAGCLFCEMDTSRIIGENALCYAIRDAFPVTELHTLIIPKRHVAEYFNLYQPEINALHELLAKLRTEITKADTSVDGFNIGVNSGISAGQTVMHCHVHLIPRRKGDLGDPRGGVRGVIPDRRIY